MLVMCFSFVSFFIWVLLFFLYRITEKIKNQLSEEVDNTKPVPANPVSMYLYAKTVTDALDDILEISEHTDNVRLKGFTGK